LAYHIQTVSLKTYNELWKTESRKRRGGGREGEEKKNFQTLLFNHIPLSSRRGEKRGTKKKKEIEGHDRLSLHLQVVPWTFAFPGGRENGEEEKKGEGRGKCRGLASEPAAPDHNKAWIQAG